MVKHMKVKKLNKSSKQTDEIIKETLAIFLNENYELNSITVTDLIKKAGISRSSFYTHYNSINDLVESIQDETLDVLSSDITNFNNIDDIYNYIDKIFEILKNNEYFYKSILNSDEAFKFANNIIDKLTDRLLIYFNNKELEVNFYTYGCAILLIKYSKNEKYSLDDISLFMKKTLKQLF